MKIKGFYITSSFFESDNFDEKNSYNFHYKYIANENNLSECDYNIENFKRFIEIAREKTVKGDARPIYVFNFFERLDAAVWSRLCNVRALYRFDKSKGVQRKGDLCI